MLDEGEVRDGEGHLAVDDPNKGCVHGGAEDIKANDFTTFAECLVIEGRDGKEEDYGGVEEGVKHPAKDAFPAEK